MATFIGTNADEIYNGTDGDDIAYGGGGDDILNGNDGGDTLIGGAGRDTISGGAGYPSNILSSYVMPDDLDGDGVLDSLDDNAERDTIYGGTAGYGESHGFAGFNDDVYNCAELSINFLGATHGIDANFHKISTDGYIDIGKGHIEGIGQIVSVEGSNYNDDIRPMINTYGGGFPTVHGNGGNDHIVGGYYVYGDDGDDTLEGGRAYGGDGNDHITHSDPDETYGGAGDDVLEGGHGDAGNDTFTLVTYGGTAYGGDGNDVFDGTTTFSTNVFAGGAGVDTIDAGSGGDLLLSGGDDPLFLNIFSFQFDPSQGLDSGLEQDTLRAYQGDDILSVGYNDNADGGDGTDQIVISWDRAAPGVALDTGDITSGPFALGTGTIQNVEQVLGLSLTDGNDIVHVTAQAGTAFIYGNGGNDELSGEGSNVQLFGGDGNDSLHATLAGDTLEGDAGNDRYYVNDANEYVSEGVHQGSDKVWSSVDYTLTDNVENLVLTTHKDIDGTGNARANRITGNGGDNVLSGWDGRDTLIGGAGKDTLIGGTRADHFEFRDSSDFGGADEASADVISDFSQAQHDRIDLDKIDVVVGDGDDPFSFIGTDAFGNQAGELRYEQVSGNTLVTGDLDGDSVADFMIVLNGTYALTEGDFAL